MKQRIKNIILAELNKRTSDFINKIVASLSSSEIKNLLNVSESELKEISDKDKLKDLFQKAYSEKPSRTLKTIIYQYKYNLDLPIEVLRAMKDTANKVKGDIRKKEPSQVRELLTDLSEMGKLKEGVRLMRSVGLLKDTLPEIHKYIETEQSGPYHLEGDVFKHTMMVLDHVKKKTLSSQMGALLHDIAKPATMELIENRITFHGHEGLGEEMIEAMLTQLGFERKIIDKVKKITVNHLRPHQLANKPNSKSIKKFLKDMGEELEDVLEMAHADGLGRIPSKSDIPKLKEKIEEVLEMDKADIKRKKEEAIKQKEDHPVSGNDVMEELGIKGVSVGDAVKLVRKIEKELKEKEGKVDKEKALKELKKRYLKDKTSSVIKKLAEKKEYPLKALYIVGGSGSGKSTIKNKMVNELNLKGKVRTENADEILEEWAKIKNIPLTFTKDPKIKEKEQELRSKAIKENIERTEDSLKKLKPIVIDTVGTNLPITQKRKLEDLGYDIKVVYIAVPKDKSLKRNRSRKNRSLPDHVVKNLWDRANKDKEELRKTFKSNFIEFDNSGDIGENKEFSEVVSDLKKFFNSPVSNPRGKTILKVKEKLKNK
ncbi:HD domain-containing protein [bacterium]|nr:HD domain-containing protein [bacterium]